MNVSRFVAMLIDNYRDPTDTTRVSISHEDLSREYVVYNALRGVAPLAPEISNTRLYAEYAAKFDATASPFYRESHELSVKLKTAVLGLCSEASELLEAPTDIHEKGDCWWYTAMICKLVHMQFAYRVLDALAKRADQWDESLDIPSPANVVRKAGLVASWVKKCSEKSMPLMEHSACPTIELEKRILDLIDALVWDSTGAGLSPGMVMEDNLRKLAARHSDGKFNPDYKSDGENA